MRREHRKTCLVFIFEGFEDSGVTHAMAGIRKSQRFHVKTIACSKDPVTSLSGLTVVPDIDFLSSADLADIEQENTAMLILTGGAAWEQHANDMITPLVAHCFLLGIPVAAISESTNFLAELGVLNRSVHTSNRLDDLLAIPSYRGQCLFQAQHCVSSDLLITASGAGAAQFAQQVFELLDIREQSSPPVRIQDLLRDVA